MMHEMTLSQLAMEFGGSLLYPDCQFTALSTDTRRIGAGDLFVALRGDNFDAHDFLPSAAKNACGLVVERADNTLQIPQWLVPDTIKALGQIAYLNRDAFAGIVIAVTGSAGKTTVKELIAAILAQRAGTGSECVLATRGNLNNHLGVPLTLLDLAPQHDSAVIEMGASGAGEISYLCQLARPKIALINNVLPAHVEGFGSIDAIATAKGEIYTGLASDGIAVLNADEVYASQWRQLIGSRRCISFGVSAAHADIRAEQIEADNAGRCRFQLLTPIGSCSVELGLSGRHNVSNALAAAAAAFAAGVELADIAAGLSAVNFVAGRMDLQILDDGTHLIDDSYNANPGSVKAAIDALAAIDGEQILVLGDMAELGADEMRLHRNVGRYAVSQGIDKLMAVGPLSRHACEGFGAGAECFSSKGELAAQLKKQLGSNTVILVKGSRSAAMEEVIALLKQSVSGANRQINSGMGET